MESTSPPCSRRNPKPIAQRSCNLFAGHHPKETKRGIDGVGVNERRRGYLARVPSHASLGADTAEKLGLDVRHPACPCDGLAHGGDAVWNLGNSPICQRKKGYVMDLPQLIRNGNHGLALWDLKYYGARRDS